MRVGVWLQPFQSNEEIALSQYGQMTFTGLPNFLAGTASFLYDPAPTPMNWRSLFGAWYVEDVMRVALRSDGVARLPRRIQHGLERGQRTGRATTRRSGAGLVCASQPASNVCLPQVGNSLFTDQPREIPAAAASSASRGVRSTRRRSSARASACTTICRMRWAIARIRTGRRIRRTRSPPPASTNIFGAAGTPIQPSAPPPTSPLALLLPGGVQPDMYTPTLVSYSVRVERRARRRTRPSASATSAATAITRSSAWTPMRPAPVVCPGVAVPRDVPDDARSGDRSAGLRRAGRAAGAGRHVFQSDEHQAEHRARQYVDVGLRRHAARTTRCRWI